MAHAAEIYARRLDLTRVIDHLPRHPERFVGLVAAMASSPRPILPMKKTRCFMG
jgi:hypothetical protein